MCWVCGPGDGHASRVTGGKHTPVTKPAKGEHCPRGAGGEEAGGILKQ